MSYIFVQKFIYFFLLNKKIEQNILSNYYLIKINLLLHTRLCEAWKCDHMNNGTVTE